MWRAAAIALAVCTAASGAAQACPGADFHTSIFYHGPPPNRWLPPGALMLDVAFDDARVRRVVHGEYRGGTIHVVVPLSSCTIPVRRGAEGVIAVRPLPRIEGEPPAYQVIEAPHRRHRY